MVQVATGMAEAMASFTPSAPNSSIDRAAAMMVPEQADAFKEQYSKSSAELAQHNVTAQAATLAAGVEALGPTVASVAVILRVTQNTPGQPPSRAVPALRVALAKRGGDWLVSDVSPLNSAVTLTDQLDSAERSAFTLTNRSDNRRIRIISEADGLALPSR